MDSEPDRPPSGSSHPAWAALVEEAPVGVFLVQDGVVVYANRWLFDFSGYGPDDVRQLDALSVIHPEDRDLVVRQMRLRLAGGAAQASYRARLVRRDGEVRTVELHPKVVAHRGRPAIQGMLIDVTEQVGVERALCESVAHMEQSNRHRRLFSDILSHDLINPVWVAENYLGLLADDDLPEDKRPIIAGIGGSLAKARVILADARIYLGIDDRPVSSSERANLGSIVEATAPALRPLWEEKGQTATFTLAAGAELAAGPLLRELVRHLLSNAIKFGPPGTPIDVVVSAEPRVRLEVRDRGPGVPEGDREQIFQRFERMEKGAISGVGLGLAIVRRVAWLYGGSVWVEANPGGGSIFVAEFPPAEP